MLVPDMAAPDGERVKLLDFGIAKLGIEHDPSPDGPTRTGQIFGTTAYMSPEQFMNGKPVDGQSDVYSLGAMIYRMLAGRLPFISEQGEMALAAMHMFELPKPLRELAPWVSPWFGDLVDLMLLKDATKRPTMNEVASLLQDHLSFRAPSRGSLPPRSISGSAPVVGKNPPPALTLADTQLPFLALPIHQAPTLVNDGSALNAAGDLPIRPADDDSQLPSVNINGQLSGSALGGLLRRPLLVAISFSLLGAGIGGAFVLRAFRPPPVAVAPVEQAGLLGPDASAKPLTPASAAMAPPAPASSPSRAPAARASSVSASAAATKPSPAKPSAGPAHAPSSHKPPPPVRVIKRNDRKKDGTPTKAAPPHSTLLDD